MRSLKLEELHWTEVKQALQNGFDTVVFGVGATEQHGPHLPLACDSLIGEALALEVAKRLGNALVAPVVRVGCSDHHMAFPGTLSIDSATLAAILTSYARTLARHGFQRIVILPSHGGNFQTVNDTVAALRTLLPEKQIVTFADLVSLLTAANKISAEFGVSAAESGIHAGEFETSLLLALRPDLIDMGAAEEGFTGDLTKMLPKLMQDGVISVSSNGILGDARVSDGGRGLKYLSAWADLVLEEIEASKVPA